MLCAPLLSLSLSLSPSLSLARSLTRARRFPFPFPKMAAVPSSLAPEPGKKLDFMALVDKEDPDDIYELIDELAVGEAAACRSRASL
jgi:hypothetical protein